MIKKGRGKKKKGGFVFGVTVLQKGIHKNYFMACLYCILYIRVLLFVQYYLVEVSAIA